MSLAPDLKKVKVSVNNLYLDPNNPRLFTREGDNIPSSEIRTPGVQDETRSRLFPEGGKDRFRIDELVQSIIRNGYVPEAGGFMFVRRISRTDDFVVLEGNRRLVAMRKILADSDQIEREHPGVIETVREINVLEIVDDLPEREIQQKIAYLLGTCHHGSHKNWSPFARARGIYNRYLEISGQDDSNFRYEKVHGEAVASLLSIKEKEVAERLAVYRAMSQIAADSRMQEKPNGGVIDSNYSLVQAGVTSSNKDLKRYLPVNPDTFELEPESVERMISLCNFDGTRDRTSPREPGGESRPPAMKNPQQWRHLSSILGDDVEEAKIRNLALVEEDELFPEDVWAKRHAERTKLNWRKWLEQVNGVLSQVNVGADFDSPEAVAVVEELETILNQLNGRSASQ